MIIIVVVVVVVTQEGGEQNEHPTTILSTFYSLWSAGIPDTFNNNIIK